MGLVLLDTNADRWGSLRRSVSPRVVPGAHLYQHTPRSLRALRRVVRNVAQSVPRPAD